MRESLDSTVYLSLFLPLSPSNNCHIGHVVQKNVPVFLLTSRLPAAAALKIGPQGCVLHHHPPGETSVARDWNYTYTHTCAEETNRQNRPGRRK